MGRALSRDNELLDIRDTLNNNNSEHIPFKFIASTNPALKNSFVLGLPNTDLIPTWSYQESVSKRARNHSRKRVSDPVEIPHLISKAYIQYPPKCQQ